MDIDQQQHLEELLRAHHKRLRVLELRAAQQGMDTPPHVLIEMDELRGEIVSINDRLADARKSLQESSMRVLPLSESRKATSLDTEKQQVEIVFRGKFANLTPELQTATVRAVAALVEISPDQITVLKMVVGSLIVWIELPREAANLLLSLYEAKDATLADLRIDRVRIISIGDLVFNTLRVGVSEQGEAQWGLKIWIDFINAHKEPLVIYDMHAKVYAKGTPKVLSTRGEGSKKLLNNSETRRPEESEEMIIAAHSSTPSQNITPSTTTTGIRTVREIFLLQDNTISKDNVFQLNSGNVEQVVVNLSMTTFVESDLLRETVFGLFVDYHTMTDMPTVRRIIPSDRIYLLLHKGAHSIAITAIDNKDIKKLKDRYGGNSETMDFIMQLENILVQHLSSGSNP